VSLSLSLSSLTHLAHGELAVLLRQPEVRGLLRGA
jgi:hypothetical protein